MSTDPEFLAMRSIKRSLDTLPDQETRQRVVNWVTDKVNSPQNKSLNQVTPTNGQVDVPQGQAISG